MTVALQPLSQEEYQESGTSLYPITLIDKRPVQPLNTFPSIFVTELGIVTVERLLQFWNASVSIVVICEFSVKDISDVQPENESLSIRVTFSGTVNDCNDEQYWNANEPISQTVFGSVMDVSDEQFRKEQEPIFVTLLPIVTEERLLHPSNNPSISRTPEGRITEESEEQFIKT